MGSERSGGPSKRSEMPSMCDAALRGLLELGGLQASECVEHEVNGVSKERGNYEIEVLGSVMWEIVDVAGFGVQGDEEGVVMVEFQARRRGKEAAQAGGETIHDASFFADFVEGVP